ncbi:aminopeptidase P family protein [Alloscardovia criceti]|uniref:aminopeptidase P family protein n=1 Tax=Alloscardovia criceti TaxID=356828 RepID=UPI00036813A1|nr:aminopeptidase P family protein [Alloscardovia criceti]
MISAHDNEPQSRAEADASDSMANRSHNRTLRPESTNFSDFMLTGWGEEENDIQPLESSRYTPSRLEALGKRFPGERIVIPAGQAKVRNDDCDYAFRPDSAFAYYTGLGQDYEAGAVLVLNPVAPQSAEAVMGKTHEPVLFLHPRSDQSTQDYYRSASYGEYWVGVRPGLEGIKTMTGIETADIAGLYDALSKDVGTEEGAIRVRIIRNIDAEITKDVDAIRSAAGFDNPDASESDDNKLYEFASESRMLKDEYEVREMRKAIAATHDGFTRMLEALPDARGKERGERILEGKFNANAREQGNAEGYGTIVASGAHAPTLHWMRNTGKISDGELLLIDAGVETDSLYTADITRTFPVNGKFTELQKELYTVVLNAQKAGFEAAKVGATYSDIHHACMRVLAEAMHNWGILPVSVEESLSHEGQQHRRWHACGVAHHLGLDVHDCSQARYESYQGAKITPGMIFTIEPGLYFKENDMLIPEEFRGIGIRIEDDVLMTENGPEWLSHDIPKEIDEVEAWMAEAAQASQRN